MRSVSVIFTGIRRVLSDLNGRNAWIQCEPPPFVANQPCLTGIGTGIDACSPGIADETILLGRFRRITVTSLFKSAGYAALLSVGLACPALAQNYADQLTPTPVIEPAGQRYILMVLDQPDHDITHGRSKVNMLVDTKTGKTWLLEYSRKPNSNEEGYVWSEVPFAAAPGE
jgi:hypothetical protein